MAKRYRVDARSQRPEGSFPESMEMSNYYDKSFIIKYSLCALSSFVIVAGAFFVMNTWLDGLPAKARGPMIMPGGATSAAGLGAVGSSAAFGNWGGNSVLPPGFSSPQQALQLQSQSGFGPAFGPALKAAHAWTSNTDIKKPLPLPRVRHHHVATVKKP